VIDLHCHTDCSDGSVAPIDLVQAAIHAGLEALAITDHDTLDGYDLARPHAEEANLGLLCGVELGTHWRNSMRSSHLLGYFSSDPGESFRSWLGYLRVGRKERNAVLLQRLRDLKIDISWDEVHALGRRQIGRPHFAKLMVEKGYVGSLVEAFDRYLGETGLAWVERQEPPLEEAIRRVIDAGGIASLAHPVRISRDRATLRETVAALLPHGLEAIECFHPEHSATDTRIFLDIATDYGLAVTGGSDFHGSYKPDTLLGTGWNGNVHVPFSVLEDLRKRFHRKSGRVGNPFAYQVNSSTCEAKP
jgi:predicted metal-dependent phosphoesterase TrpH